MDAKYLIPLCIAILIVVAVFKDVLKEAFSTLPVWLVFGGIMVIVFSIIAITAFKK